MSLARIGTDTVDGTMVADIKRRGMITDCILRWTGAASSRIVVMPHPDDRRTFHPQCRHGRRIPLPGLFFLCSVADALDAARSPGMFYFDMVTPAELAIFFANDLAAPCVLS